MDKAENTQSAEALETREITIAGMGCDNCARKLDRALRAKDGVKEVRVDSIAGRATVTFDPAKTNIPELQEVVVKSGYRAGAVELASNPPRG
jgi:copper chaperone CopZ